MDYNYTSRLVAKLDVHEVDDLLFIGATAITPGEYKGIDGKTIIWGPEVLSEAAPTGRKKPIIHTHTDQDGDEKELIVGFVSEMGDDQGKLRLKGYLYDDTAFPFVESGDLGYISPEIDFFGDYDPATNKYTATKADFTSFVLTNKPADRDAVIDEFGFVHVSLERKNEEKKLDDKVKLEDKLWKDMTGEERLSILREHIKDGSIELPEDAPGKPKEPEDEPVDDPELDEPPQGPTSEEFEDLQKQLKYFQDIELASIATDIKKVDDEFKMEKYLEGVEGFMARKAKLEGQLATLNRIVPKIKLELGGQAPAQLTAKLEEKKSAYLEMFGAEKAKEYAPELFGVKEA